MAITTVFPSQAQSTKYEFSPAFTTWQGFVDTIPILRALLLKTADATTTSSRTYGSHSRSAKEWLNGVIGNGKQTFKMLNRTGVVIGMTGGDELYLIDEDNRNLKLLDPQNITFVVENGVITKYKERSGSGVSFTPEQILHIPNNPNDTRPFGKSDVENCKDLLLDWVQVWDDMPRIYHSYVRPTEVWHLKTNFPEYIEQFKRQLAEVRKTPEAKLVIPNDLVDKVDRISIPQGSTLDPTIFENRLTQRIFQSWSIPELALGAGNANSEEADRMLHSGFRQTVRMRQQWREECIELQLFKKLWPEKTPKIEFSFAAEPEEEKFERYRKFFNDVNNSTLQPQAKSALLEKIIDNMGVIK